MTLFVVATRERSFSDLNAAAGVVAGLAAVLAAKSSAGRLWFAWGGRAREVSAIALAHTSSMPNTWAHPSVPR